MLPGINDQMSFLCKYILLAFLIAPDLCFAKYNRDDFNFRTYSPLTYTGWYTGRLCKDIDIDHVVSLQDAYNSGASSWSNAKKERFANDRVNHVSACASINRSKGASLPKDVIRKAGDGRGVDFEFYDLCGYIKKYYKVKKKYKLSFKGNSSRLFRECGVTSQRVGSSVAVPAWQRKKDVRSIGNVKKSSGKYGAVSGAFHGNTKSHVFHSSSCRYYNCKSCTRGFSSRTAALKAGYRPCGSCKP